MIVCPYCDSSRYMKGKKKFKCLDCFKSFKYARYIEGEVNENVGAVVSLMQKATMSRMVKDASEIVRKNYNVK